VTTIASRWMNDVLANLYGRGTADDRYAGYTAVTALTASHSHPRTVILLETSNESGSPDLDPNTTCRPTRRRCSSPWRRRRR
jgi:acetylornithine deacetylase/succinyl-diaminopimelate desuccinylase-like protein